MTEILAILIKESWWLALLQGMATTVVIAVCALFTGLFIGFGLALVKWAKTPAVRWCVDIYTLIIRGVPEILVIYVFFFASDDFHQMLASAFGYGSPVFAIFPVIVVILAVGLIASSYATEVIRGALNAVPKGVLEAGSALGFSKWQKFWVITFPQTIRLALPGINNIWQNTIKDTALVSLVAVSELLFRTQLGASLTGYRFLFYGIALVLYLLITIISQYIFRLFERRLAVKGGVAR